MKYPFSLTPDEFVQEIGESNKAAYEQPSKYPVGEESAICRMYSFIQCPCDATCQCRQLACNGHYVIKPDIPFEDYLTSFVECWVAPNQRKALHRCIMTGVSYGGRAKNAIEVLNAMKENWTLVIRTASTRPWTLLCNLALEDSPAWFWGYHGIYEAKARSLLFFDVLLRFG